jgi:hypothetical protein
MLLFFTRLNFSIFTARPTPTKPRQPTTTKVNSPTQSVDERENNSFSRLGYGEDELNETLEEVEEDDSAASPRDLSRQSGKQKILSFAG